MSCDWVNWLSALAVSIKYLLIMFLWLRPNIFKIFDWLGVSFVLRCLTDVERDCLWDPTLSGLWSSCTGCWHYLSNMQWLMYRLLLVYLSASLWCFCARGIYVLTKMDWTSYHGPPLYQGYILNILINRNVLGLATDSPCGFLGHGWTTCLPRVVHLKVYVFKQQLVWKYDIVESNLLLMFCLYGCLHILPKLHVIFRLILFCSETVFIPSICNVTFYRRSFFPSISKGTRVFVRTLRLQMWYSCAKHIIKLAWQNWSMDRIKAAWKYRFHRMQIEYYYGYRWNMVIKAAYCGFIEVKTTLITNYLWSMECTLLPEGNKATTDTFYLLRMPNAPISMRTVSVESAVVRRFIYSITPQIWLRFALWCVFI